MTVEKIQIARSQWEPLASVTDNVRLQLGSRVVTQELVVDDKVFELEFRPLGVEVGRLPAIYFFDGEVGYETSFSPLECVGSSDPLNFVKIHSWTVSENSLYVQIPGIHEQMDLLKNVPFHPWSNLRTNKSDWEIVVPTHIDAL